MLALGPTAAAALPKVYLYLRPPTRTVIGATRWPAGWMANVVGVKPIRWSTRLGMTELKNVSSTRCADAVAGASRKAATTRAGQRTYRVDQRVRRVSNGLPRGRLGDGTAAARATADLCQRRGRGFEASSSATGPVASASSC